MTREQHAAAYWRERCEQAERALRAARTGIQITPARREVLQLLGELRPGDAMITETVAKRVGRTINAAYYVLRGLQDVGLVAGILPSKPAPGAWAKWQLGHLVVVEDGADDSGATNGVAPAEQEQAK